MNYKKMLIPLFLIFPLSCAPVIVPVPTPGAIINTDTRSISQEKEGIKITVMSDAWKYEPVEVKYKFTPFYISIGNGTESNIIIDEDSIFLFDETNTQYGVVPAGEVERAVISSSYRHPIIIYSGSFYRHGWLGLGMEFAYPYDEFDSEVIPRALRFGPISPGARVQGFVYLQEPQNEARYLSLEISLRTESGETITLTFGFNVE